MTRRMVALAGGLLMICGLNLRADTGWVIERLDITLEVQPDGSVLALDVVDVDVQGLSRRWISRDVRYRFDYDETRNRECGIDLIRITAADGRRHPVRRSEDAGTVRFQIGDPDRTISGKETYRIQYRIGGALVSLADHDELYWNATGVWPVETRHAAVIVRAPAGAIERVECFQGFPGSTTRCRAEFTPDQAIFTATRPLAQNEQLTVVTGLRKGVVSTVQPRLVNKPRGPTGFFESAPWLLTLMFDGFFVAIGGVVWLWWTVGRDRRYVGLHHLSQETRKERVPFVGDRPIAIEFEPPDGIRPAQLGLLIDEQADARAVTPTIVDLAVRGYLSIAALPKADRFAQQDWQLARLKEPGADLLSYERIVLAGLFESHSFRKVSELPDTFHADLARAERALCEDGIARRWFPANPNTTRVVARTLGLVIAVGGVFLTVWLGRGWGAGLAGLPVIAGGLLLALVARKMPRRTGAGRAMMRRALGFARFLRTAETHQHKVRDGASVFTAYLAYAVAFKSVDSWTRAFGGVDLQAATADWYVGPSGFDTNGFSSGLAGFSSSLSSALTAHGAEVGGRGRGIESFRH